MPVHRLLFEFRVRDGSSRAKLLTFLGSTFSKQRPKAEAMDAAFGTKKGSKQSFAKLVCEIKNAIDERHLNYEIRTQKDKRGETIGLYPVEDNDFRIGAPRATLAALNPKGRLTG